MKDFRTRAREKKSFIHSWLFLLLLFVVLGFFGKSAYASFLKKRRARLELIKYEREFKELLDKKHELESRIEGLKTERGIEEELRKRFNIVKDGEIPIRIIETEDKNEGNRG